MQITKQWKMIKCTKWKSIKWQKMIKKHQKKGGSIFGLKTGSRGTPWNRKSAQPGGSENANCQKVPFKWHFGVFEGGSIFDQFLSLFTFLILMIFTFSPFLILSLFYFFWFLHFPVFCVLLILINFCWFFLLCTYFDHFLCLN